jgi:hypothetical protein
MGSAMKSTATPTMANICRPTSRAMDTPVQKRARGRDEKYSVKYEGHTDRENARFTRAKLRLYRCLKLPCKTRKRREENAPRITEGNSEEQGKGKGERPAGESRAKTRGTKHDDKRTQKGKTKRQNTKRKEKTKRTQKATLQS